MSRATQKGTAFETQVVTYLASALGTAIERRAKHGTKDRGDISGVFIGGKPCVIECKNRKQTKMAEWLGEAEVERGNADAEYGVVIHKRQGIGAARMGETYVTMTLETFAAIIAGGHEFIEGGK